MKRKEKQQSLEAVHTHTHTSSLTKQKGITLIALVITIIVLLILAGVSIAMLTGENGLLSKTEEAQEANRMATAKEKVELAIFASWDEQGNFNKEQFKKEIENQGGSIVEEKETTITVQMDIYEFVVDVEAGKIIDVKVGSTSIEYEVTPDESIQAPSRTIKIKARNSKNPIVSIKKPDNTIVDGGEAVFEATKDGNYTFVITDSTGREIEETVTVSNIVETVNLLKGGQGYPLLGKLQFSTHNEGSARIESNGYISLTATARNGGASYARAISSESLNFPAYTTLNIHSALSVFDSSSTYTYFCVFLGGSEVRRFLQPLTGDTLSIKFAGGIVGNLTLSAESCDMDKTGACVIDQMWLSK